MPGESDITRELVSRARRVRTKLRVGPGALDLAAIDTRDTPGLPRRRPGGLSGKAWAAADLDRLAGLITEHQARLHAVAASGGTRWRVLLVLQAMDGGGKDGTVKAVVGSMNPLGVRITAFGPPTPEELGHHFLWRVHHALPGVGYVGIFNRSHYEDVLVARVRGLVPARVWRRRYEEINEFERVQVADGTTIIKIMLHISKDEQRERLLARLDDPAKRWKFDPHDLDDRGLWDAYQEAYHDAIERCDTPEAPWYVVPADRKWYRNWAVANLLLAHLEEVHLDYPAPDFDVEAERRRLAAEPKANNR